MKPALPGRYAIVRELGRGGMATVYLAEDLELHRQVALKVLRPELAASLGSQRFLREIEIAARLDHPHILSLLDSGDAGGHLYYEMPYVEGESLRQRLEREGQLPVSEVIAIIKAVASALTYAHEQGVVHRDIKPENILLARNDDGTFYPVVADFGIARALDKAGGERLTETGLALGTPAYMSPEQAGSDRRLDGRSDIYALGCVAYEMLAGSPPFTGTTGQAILARHAVDQVPPLHTVRSTLPAPVEAAIERALAKVPGDRFATADEFVRALESESPVRSPRRRTAAFGWRRIAPALVLGAALIGVGVRVFGNSRVSTVLPSASKIAVLPLLSLGTDTALARLGKDLANTISASLAGVGGIETADRLTIGASTTGKDLSPADGAALARRLGATSVVHGTLVGAGEQVRLDLGLYGTEKLEPLARGVTVTAHRDSIRMLTDSASLGLLRQVWQRGVPPTPSLAAVTTHSIPALRAFLDGERAIEENRWDNAELAFAAAMSADSSFGLAYWRHTQARGWQRHAPDGPTLQRAMAYTSRLPEKERLLAEIWSSNEPQRENLRLSKALTERFPDYWPGWFQYGDMLFHDGPLVGHNLHQAKEVLQRTVQLNPRLEPAWGHLDLIAVALQDSILLARTRASLDTLMAADQKAAEGAGFVWPMDLHLMRGGGFEGHLSDSVLAFLRGQRGFYQVWAPALLSYHGHPDAQIEMSRRIVARNPSPVVTAIHRRGIGLSWGARGAWDSALTAMDAYADRAPELAGVSDEQIEEAYANPEVARGDPYRTAVIGAWLGALDPSLAATRRPAASQAVARMASPPRQMELFWLDGILAASKRDLGGLRHAQGEFRKARAQFMEGDSTTYRVLLQTLTAFELELLGRRRQAADTLAAVAWGLQGWVGPYTFPVSRIAAARWLAAERDLDQAAGLLPWHQAFLVHFDHAHGKVALDGVSYLEMARVEIGRGNQDLARDYYRLFLQRYDLASPRMQHLVDEARAAMARLSGFDPAETR